MIGVLSRADDVLRQRPWTTRSSRSWHAIGQLALQLILFGMLYGAVMGSFGGFRGDRCWQVFYSAAKVPLLLLVTFSIGLPSFFVLNTLFGLRRDFGEAVRALLATQAGMAIVLASLAPITTFWYAGSDNYNAALRLNLLAFAIATLGAKLLLHRYYRPLIRRNRKHAWMLWTWVIIYAFVGVQMSWVLRPFIGSPSSPVQFFREGAWGNAYVVVFELLRGLFTG
jgi:hypothetical protein